MNLTNCAEKGGSEAEDRPHSPDPGTTECQEQKACQVLILKNDTETQKPGTDFG